MSKDKPKMALNLDDFKNLSTEQVVVRVVLMYLLANNLISGDIAGL